MPSVGKNQIKMQLKTAEAVNELMKNKIVAKNKLKCYAPNYLFLKSGVIIDVDTALTDVEIKEDIKLPFQITYVCRKKKQKIAIMN